MRAIITESSTGRYYFRSDSGDLLWLGGGNKEEAIASFSKLHPDIRLDYNPNQPRDARGRWASGGGGGGGGATFAPKKSSGGSGGGGDLGRKKLTELEAIAKEVGAATPTKYKNRKSSWITEIEKVKGKGGGDTPPKPPKPPADPKLGDKRYTADELSKKKVADLEAIAKEVGAATPAKYKNRKSSWIAEIEKAQGNKPSLPTTPPKPPKVPKTGKSSPSFYKAKSFTHTELAKSGESYAQQYIKKAEIKPSARELKLEKKLNGLRAEIKAALDSGDMAKVRRLSRGFSRMELDHLNLRDDRLRKNTKEQGFEDLQKAIIKQSAVTRQEAEALADRVIFDSSLSAIEATNAKMALTDFFELTGGRGKDYLSNVKFDDPRAYANRAGTVNIGDGSRNTLFHEFAHHAEYNSDKLRQEAIAWRNSRATSQTPEKLSKLTGEKGYGDDEVAVPDKFIDPYVGKVYNTPFGELSTEVISMGIERFSSPEQMRRFREKDPDHFHFILGVLTNNED